MAEAFQGAGTTVRGNIPYAELADFAVNYKGDVVEARRLVNVNADNGTEFMRNILPLVQIGDQVGVVAMNIAKWFDTNPPADVVRKKLLRFDPEPHPKYPNLYSTQAEIVKGIGSPAQEAGAPNKMTFKSGPGQGEHGGVQIAIAYRPIPYLLGAPGSNDALNVEPEANFEHARYVSVKHKPAGKAQQVQGALCASALPTNIAGLNVYFRIPEFLGTIPILENHIIITWHMCPRIPDTAFYWMGCVNSTVFGPVRTNGPTGLPAIDIGKLLYLFCEHGDPYPLFDGTMVCDLNYHFLFRPTPHNWVFRPAVGMYVPTFRTRPGEFLPQPPSPDPNYRYAPGRNAVADYANLNKLFYVQA